MAAPAKEKPKRVVNYGDYVGLGLQMVLVMGSAMWAGIQLDRYLGWRFPVCLLLFSLVSFLLTIYITIRKLLYTVHHASNASEKPAMSCPEIGLHNHKENRKKEEI